MQTAHPPPSGTPAGSAAHGAAVTGQADGAQHDALFRPKRRQLERQPLTFTARIDVAGLSVSVVAALSDQALQASAGRFRARLEDRALSFRAVEKAARAAFSGAPDVLIPALAQLQQGLEDLSLQVAREVQAQELRRHGVAAGAEARASS